MPQSEEKLIPVLLVCLSWRWQATIKLRSHITRMNEMQTITSWPRREALSRQATSWLRQDSVYFYFEKTKDINQDTTYLLLEQSAIQSVALTGGIFV